jgi:hypothetical protein
MAAARYFADYSAAPRENTRGRAASHGGRLSIVITVS